jgi:hypothetical protein
VFKVKIAAEGVRGAAAERAVFMSDFERGEPVTMVRPD